MDDVFSRRLVKVLEQERAALTHGDFEAVDSLAPEKAKLLAGLTEAKLPAESLRAISQQIDRNQILLAAFLRGMKSAEKTISGQHTVRTGTLVYGRNGEVSKMEIGSKSILKKL